MKFFFWILFFLIHLEASAGCWKLTGCYAIKFDSNNNKIKGHLASGDYGMRFLALDSIKGFDGGFYCLENVQKDKEQCEYFYHCKPVNYKKQNNIDWDSREFIELKWSLRENESLKKGSIRGSFKIIENWQMINTSFEHWRTISSNDPTCSINTKERD